MGQESWKATHHSRGAGQLDGGVKGLHHGGCCPTPLWSGQVLISYSEYLVRTEGASLVRGCALFKAASFSLAFGLGI